MLGKGTALSIFPENKPLGRTRAGQHSGAVSQEDGRVSLNSSLDGHAYDVSSSSQTIRNAVIKMPHVHDQ